MDPRRASLLAGGACAVAAAALLASLALGPLPAAAYVLAGLLAFCAGRWGTTAIALGGMLALLGALETDVLVEHGDAVPPVLVLVAVCGAGRALRERERVAALLARRARELEEEREAYAALSVRFERARIAAELHDIVAHALSVMVVQASAGQRLAAVDVDLTAETFVSIAGAAQQAEQDVARLVALLADEQPAAPAVDTALIEELVARAQASGLSVTLRLEGESGPLPAELAAIAYRIVQEGMTNALRYASGAVVDVVVHGAASELVVTVVNGGGQRTADLAGAGSGQGLRGLRERIGAAGGTLEAGPTPDGGWRVSAWLPR